MPFSALLTLEMCDTDVCEAWATSRLPGGIKRYLDDVLVCIGCKNEEAVLRAQKFVRWVKTA